MTRNNLADHLTWLLNNVSLTTPPVVELPPINLFTRDDSNSFPSQLLGTTVARGPASTGSQGQLQQQNSLNRAGHGTTVIVNVTEDTDCWQDSGSTMGRLTSTVKSKKPSLISQPNHLPTPDSTVHSGTRMATALGKSCALNPLPVYMLTQI